MIREQLPPPATSPVNGLDQAEQEHALTHDDLMGVNELPPPRATPENPLQFSNEVLHDEAITLPENVLITREDALKTYGINADILAVIKLPKTGEGQLKDSIDGSKQIAVVDHGEFTEENGPYLWYFSGGSEDGSSDLKPARMLGKAKSRFGLLALNYVPKDHLHSYIPIDYGEVQIGREGRDSYRLGLTEEHAGNDAISSSHFSVVRGSDDTISIVDHSRLGTFVTLPANDR